MVAAAPAAAPYLRRFLRLITLAAVEAGGLVMMPLLPGRGVECGQCHNSSPSSGRGQRCQWLGSVLERRLHRTYAGVTGRFRLLHDEDCLTSDIALLGVTTRAMRAIRERIQRTGGRHETTI